jgi:hypothetical protein
MDKQRQGEQRGHNMEAPHLAIWGVEKVIFFIISKWRSETMVLYPSSIRVQRAENTQNGVHMRKWHPKYGRLQELWRTSQYSRIRPYHAPVPQVLGDGNLACGYVSSPISPPFFHKPPLSHKEQPWGYWGASLRRHTLHSRHNETLPLCRIHSRRHEALHHHHHTRG